ncbi:MAG: molybdopterin-dependent oxidoreductase [Chloroflexota bacterium]|nr:molybdopterin-dependent oxidoreductase [Chloroflexota bacterium]
MVATSPSLPTAPSRVQRAARAGAVAALVMLFAQLGWRLFGASAGAQSFPEFIVAAVARLTPLNFFGYMTETFGSLAQNSLFVVVLIGVVVVGYEAGTIAERLFATGRFGDGPGGRVLSGLAIAALLFIFTMLVVLPVAYLGFFARSSRNSTEIVLQLVATFALYAIAWAVITAVMTGDAMNTEQAAGPGPADQHVARRAFLGAGTLALTGGVGVLAWRVMQPRTVADEAASQQAAQEIAARAGGRVSTQAATPPPVVSETDQADALEAATRGVAQVFEELEAAGELTPRITAVADFYHVSKNLLDPTVDAESWSLTIDGLVDTPLTFNYEDLVTRATTQNISTLCCISNELNGDLVGTAEWTGVPLAELLSEAGVQAEAIDLKFSCADDYEDSIPVAVGQDPNVLVVVGMNGEPLAPDHGYPARLIVPPIYGMKNVKWVQRIELVDHDFLGYWQTRGWDDTATYQIWGRIDSPTRRDTLQPGPVIAAGVASAGDRGISRVELSLDEGETWADATLEPSINPPFTWVRWAFPFEATVDMSELTMRATDGEGNVATSQRRPPLPAGATGWPQQAISAEAS